jgi:hypothetical protein
LANTDKLKALVAQWQAMDALGADRPVGDLVYRAEAYLAQMPVTQCGTQSCHNKTFDVPCVLCNDFGLADEQAYPLLVSWCRRGTHVWSEGELRHKLASARQRGRPSTHRFGGQGATQGNGQAEASVAQQGQQAQQGTQQAQGGPPPVFGRQYPYRSWKPPRPLLRCGRDISIGGARRCSRYFGMRARPPS